MSRGILNDELRVHEFHLLDVDWSFSVPPFVLFPSVGFSSITAPEMTIETEEVREGTDDFVHHVLDKASTNTITLSKGVTPFNSDFWRWTVSCLKGNSPDLVQSLLNIAAAASLGGSVKVPGKRRNLLLMHLTGISPIGLFQAMSSGSVLDKIKGNALLPAAGIAAAAGGLSRVGQGMLDVGITSIPGKMFILMDCLPTRYKPGSDFEANTTAVSIEEIDISYHYFEEFAIGG